jgi:hypothetical protein
MFGTDPPWADSAGTDTGLGFRGLPGPEGAKED